MKVAKGQCLCGAVTIEVPGECVHDVSVCHCNMCRQWSGGPLLAVECKQGLVMHGEENVTHYCSSEWAERTFCRVCGTHLYYLLLETQTYELSAGIFPDDRKRLVSQIYVESKPGFYDFAQRTPMLTEQDILEQFNGS
ncbi:MAG: GFA family protein [Symbiopectobacterium sp.]|uniref:GFA family protein n=1 Tax=Symbiopectobacterium sp. TaxID=2952789 RepID=UPI0039E7A8A3